jgi:hypothetical protein
MMVGLLVIPADKLIWGNSMRIRTFVPLVLLVVSSGISAAAQDATRPAAPAPQPPTADLPADKADKSRIVYVSDFELDVATGKDEKGAPSATPGPAAQPDAKEIKKEEDAAEQASKLVDLLSSTLVKELEKAGYTARRMRPGEARPEEGIKIHGVFAEPDEQNRLRRAVIGNGVGIGKMALFVGVSNLARPDQPLYALADPKTNENKQGPVITVSAYTPVAKFELPKNATETTVEDTASKIVAGLSILLSANVAAVTQ